MNIFVTRTFPGNGLNMLTQAGHSVVVSKKDAALTQEELIAELSRGSYVALLCMLTDQIDAKFLDAAPDLKIVANYAVGYDNINIEEAKKRGIIVTNTPDVLTNSVAEHAVALMLALARRISESDKYIRNGKWDAWAPDLLLGTELAGKTLGLVGVGRIGSRVAHIANEGFGMGILYHDVRRNELLEKDTDAQYASEIESLLPSADIVSIHVPRNGPNSHCRC